MDYYRIQHCQCDRYPLSGMLSNLFGRKAYFTGSVILFTGCSLLCGLSTTLWEIVIWRFAQGLGGGGLLSTAQSIVVDAFPPEKVNTANAIFGIGVIIGPMAGPVLGGVLVEKLSWHWIFFVNLPVGALASLLSLLYVPDLAGSIKPRRIDWWGILFLAVSVSSMQFVLEEGGLYDWFSSTTIIILSLVAVFGMIAFVRRELIVDYPAVKISLLRSFNLSVGNFLMLISGGIMAGAMFIFPLFVRVSLGWTPLQTGMFLMYFALSATFGMLIAGKLLESRINSKIMMIGGLLLMSLYLYMLSFSAPDTAENNYILPMILGGLGATAFMLPIMSLSIGGLRGADLAQGTGLSNMLKRLGNAIGIAVLNIYLDHQNAQVGNALSAHITIYNPLVRERLQAFRHFFFLAGYATNDTMKAAYQLLEELVYRQQILISFDHGYFMMSIVILICIPLILLIRPTAEQSQKETAY